MVHLDGYESSVISIVFGLSWKLIRENLRYLYIANFVSKMESIVSIHISFELRLLKFFGVSRRKGKRKDEFDSFKLLCLHCSH